MRLRVAVVAALVLVVALTTVTAGLSTLQTGHCAQDLKTIKVGTGNIGIDLAVLHDVNHVDVAYPTCSSGRFSIGEGSGNFLYEQHCSEGFVRLYAPVGTAGERAIINWRYADGTCG